MSVLLCHIVNELSNLRIYGPEPTIGDMVESVCVDSRKAGKNALFVCIKGFVSDGHAYAPKAYEQGCRYFLVQELLDLPADAMQLLVPDTRIAEAEAAAAFYGHPERSMELFAITGTKGKTTTALFLQKNSLRCGHPHGLHGYQRHHFR